MKRDAFVSVIVINYNGKNFVGECLDSLLASTYQNFEIVIVDNDSTDGSFAYLSKKYGGNNKVKILRSEKQLYFTGGCNFGAKKARGRKLFFLNSDTVADKNCLKELVEFTFDHPKYLVQPRILQYNSPHLIDNVGGRYSFWGFGYGIGRGKKDKGQYKRNRQVDFVNGTAFLIGQDFFWSLGGFDEQFKYFYEDVDLCLRAKKAGGKCWYCSKSIIYHHGSLTFKKNLSRQKMKFYLRRNRLLTLRKHNQNMSLFVKSYFLSIVHFLLLIKDKLGNSDLFKFSSVVFLGTNLVNLINFIFMLTMARLLDPKFFGEMTALFSLLLLMGIPSEMIINIVIKFTADFKAKKAFLLIKKLFISASRLSFLIGTLLLIVFWSLTPFLSSFFHVDLLPFIIFGLIFPIGLLSAVTTGMLQGFQKFIPLSLSSVVATLLKLLLAVLFISLGFSVAGVMAAFVAGIFVAYIYALSRIDRYLTSSPTQKQERFNLIGNVRQEILSYAKTVFGTTLLLAMFANIDMILVKHYLAPETAGHYATLITAGRIIPSSAAPFLIVMFPLVSASYAKRKGEEKYIFKISLGIILAISIFVLLIFALLPEFVIKTLFGHKYLPISPYLLWIGLVMLFNTLSRGFISFFLAIHEKGFLYPLGISVVLQTLLIIILHQNIFLIILSILMANLILFFTCWTIYHFKK